MSKPITYEVKVYLNDRTEWRLNGKLHREDGPAIEYETGNKSWYLNDECLSHAEWKEEVAKLNQPTRNGKVVEIEGKKYRLVEIEIG